MRSYSGSALRIWGIFKKSVDSMPASGEDGWLSLARRGLGQVSHEMGGGRWKSQDRKKVYLSPYVEEPLNSKVIRSFVTEQRSRRCFSSFEIPMFYVQSLWTFDVRFRQSHIMAMVHIHVLKCTLEHTHIHINNDTTFSFWQNFFFSYSNKHLLRIISDYQLFCWLFLEF